jgi:hypothetical protein
MHENNKASLMLFGININVCVEAFVGGRSNSYKLVVFIC